MPQLPLSDLVTVCDDFLEESAFVELVASIKRASVYPPGYDEYPGLVWRLGDTPPMLSKEIYQSTRADNPGTFAPLATRLKGHEFASLRIREFSIRLQVAPVGSCLSMHYDGNDPDSGGFAFYLNDTWDPHWGGLLIAFDPGTFVEQKGFTLLRAQEQRDALNDTVLNLAITPRRNRLVLLRNPVRHMVTQVLPGAGDRSRIACTGYYRVSRDI